MISKRATLSKKKCSKSVHKDLLVEPLLRIRGRVHGKMLIFLENMYPEKIHHRIVVVETFKNSEKKKKDLS